MPTNLKEPLAALYEQDETAWLEIMAELLAHGSRLLEVDDLQLND